MRHKIKIDFAVIRKLEAKRKFYVRELQEKITMKIELTVSSRKFNSKMTEPNCQSSTY